MAGIHGELLEIIATIELGNAAKISLNVRGVPVIYDVKSQELSCLGNKASLKPADGKIALQIFVDRTAVDIFSKEGRVYLPMAAAIPAEDTSLALNAVDGEARIDSLVVYELKSAWE